ncbi:hypothetical protein KC678_00270 [Candidatus Dojkabacteria bacterium]|uniref:Uncharacterized protein n=1 Tax=Candidatus Dojkabacteria bacterium TaxID=2099670 RepID=A0A955I9U7_9BACT|nr:hypothetical protein [Candidatus Dojkabacteria bacterium]
MLTVSLKKLIKVVFVAAFIAVGFMTLPLLSSASFNLKVNAQATCTCSAGATSDQGCAAFGCPVGTRRQCTCGIEADQGLCTLPGSYNPLQHGLWSCYCVPDSSCTVSNPGTPPPGCDPNAWGACSVSCGGGTQTNACGDTRACNTQSCCSGVAPTVFTQTAPTDGYVFPSGTKDIYLAWNQTSFGTNCSGNVNTYTVWLYKGGTCATAINDLDVSPTITSGAWTSGVLNSSTSSYTVTNLGQDGVNYCWLVLKSNGDQLITTDFWDFSVANPAPPSAPTQPSVTPTCSSGDIRLNITWSGTAGDSYHIDIDNEASFANSFYNYPYPNPGTTSTNVTLVDGNFTRYNPTDNAPLTMTAGTTYYARVYSIGTGLTSAVRSFVAPNCATPSAPTITSTCTNANGSANMRISWDVISGWSDDGIFIDISTTGNFGDNLHYNRQVAAGAATNQGYLNFNSYTEYFTRYPSNGTLTPSQIRFEPGNTYYVKIYYIRFGNNSAPNYAAGNSAVRTINYVGCCGDGYDNAAEQCDAGSSNGVSCNPGTTANSTCNYCTSTCTTATVYAPKGSHDPQTCTAATGWACDPQNYSRYVDVHVYARDLSTNVTTFVGADTANELENATVGAQCNNNPNRGFTVPITSIINGNQQQITAYAISGDSRSNPILLNSPRTIDTLTCIARPTISSANVSNDTCGTGYSGRTGGINTNVTNPMEFVVTGQEPATSIKNVEFYLVPKTATDGAQNGIFEATATPFRSTVISKVAQSDGIAISFNPITRVLYTLDPNTNNWKTGTEGNQISTYRGLVTATMTGTTLNPTVTFQTEFNDDFYNGTYSLYYTVINNYNATPDNDATNDTTQIRLRRWGDWGVDTDPPTIVLSDPTFITNKIYTMTRNASEAAGANQSGLNATQTRSYLHTSNLNADYQYQVDSSPGFNPVSIIYQDDPAYPATPSNISEGLNESHTYEDLQSFLSIPVSHTMYVADNACNVTKVTKSVTANALAQPWLMSVGGSISAGGSVENISIPNEQIDIPGYYDGEAALTTESLIAGTNVIPSQRVSLKDNVLINYNDDSISVPAISNFDSWYDHLLDRIERENGSSLDSVGDVVIDSYFSNSGLFPDVNAEVPSEKPVSEDVTASDNQLELLQDHSVVNPQVVQTQTTPYAPVISSTCQSNGTVNIKFTWATNVSGWSGDGIFIDISKTGQFGENKHYNHYFSAGSQENAGTYTINTSNTTFFIRYPSNGTLQPTYLTMTEGQTYYIRYYYPYRGSQTNWTAGETSVKVYTVPNCPATVTCSQCTTSTSDGGACINQTYSDTCPSGWSQGTNSCSSCPATINCSRCTTTTSDAANACENSTITVSSSQYTCPTGWVSGTNTCGSSCVTEITCYRCTSSTSDGNTCESFVYQGSTCPAGSTNSSNCAVVTGGSCPVEITCYKCTDPTNDGNTCESFIYAGSSCPSGTSATPGACAAAVGGSCQSTITCYQCSASEYDGNTCEPFVQQGTSCPTGTSTSPTGCSGVVGGFCPTPVHQDTIAAVKVDNLTITSGAICDQQGIVFVENDLIIEPDLLTGHNQNGCIFIVKGNVIVKPGDQKTVGVGIFTNTPAEYDIIEGFFIVGGDFITELDNIQGDTFKWDGLIVKGGVYAQNLDLRRDLNGNGSGNIERPSHLFIYDPRYKKIYEKTFSSRFYSLREVQK